MHPQIEKFRRAYWDFLDHKLAPLKQQHKLTILAVSLLVPVILFIFLIYSPNSEKITKLDKDNIYLQGEIQKVEALAGKHEEHKAELAAVELQLKAASLLLPKQKEIPSLLTNISEQGSNSGLEFISFQPRDERNEQFYAIIPVAITVSGTYHKIGSFLDKTSKLNRIVSVNNISLGSPKVTSGEVILTASMELVTYRFLSASEQQQNVEPKQATARRRR
jgi:type IV pilus assembly protein PilO